MRTRLIVILLFGIFLLVFSCGGGGVPQNTNSAPAEGDGNLILPGENQGATGQGMMMFFMMNMWASPASPVVAPSGFIYTVSAGALPMPFPFTGPVESTLTQIATDGSVTNITLNGTVSAPLLNDTRLIVSVSQLTNNSQSALHIFPLPLVSGAVPVTVNLNGNIASVPTVSSNAIYVRTSTATFMMGGGMFMFPGTSGPSFLYVIDFTGTVVSMVQL